MAAHPITFGVFAALGRWLLGDRAGGLRALLAYMSSSLLVAWGASYWLAEEVMSSGRRSLYLLLLAFVAKDVLIAILTVAQQFGANPFEVIRRIRKALAGGPDS